MDKAKLKLNLHKTIDEIENLIVLERLKDIVDFTIKKDNADFWEELSENERDEINKALLESEVDENLIPHDEVMKQAKQWLIK
ncbi:MAG: hypothetical protein LH629_02660 [Ignavibacteria bacterium]|nr:hypothetical protein [Ignavibacteria bacterium]